MGAVPRRHCCRGPWTPYLSGAQAQCFRGCCCTLAAHGWHSRVCLACVYQGRCLLLFSLDMFLCSESQEHT